MHFCKLRVLLLVNALYIVESLSLTTLISWDHRIDIDKSKISIWLIRGPDFAMINTVRRFDKTKPHDTVNTIDGRPRLAFLSTVESFYCTKRLTICYYMHVLLCFRSRIWRTRDNKRTSRTRYMVSVILNLLRHLSQVRRSWRHLLAARSLIIDLGINIINFLK